ncbi:MAG: MurR/RpiR family transcriptional regulator [Solobacterium sp.]|nr:MurR/RpiR family transcriptional regulator [Solobacterium sp.]
MNDRISMGSVSEKLLNFIDTAQVHDSYYEIALTLVKNYEKVKTMPIAEMADLCYVSQATISRFCRFLGYENFKRFHDDMNLEFRLLDDYTGQFRSLLRSSDRKAAEMYQERVRKNLETALSEENFREIRRAADLIAAGKRTAFFSHHFLWDAGHYFQTKMIMMDRYIELYQSYDNQMKCAQSLDEDCTAIICSAGGTYFSYYRDLTGTILNSKAKVIVLTQNVNSNLINGADLVIRCGETNQDDTGKFAMLAVIDHLVLQFMKRHYSIHKGENLND